MNNYTQEAKDIVKCIQYVCDYHGDSGIYDTIGIMCEVALMKLSAIEDIYEFNDDLQRLLSDSNQQVRKLEKELKELQARYTEATLLHRRVEGCLTKEEIVAGVQRIADKFK